MLTYNWGRRNFLEIVQNEPQEAVILGQILGEDSRSPASSFAPSVLTVKGFAGNTYEGAAQMQITLLVFFTDAHDDVPVRTTHNFYWFGNNFLRITLKTLIIVINPKMQFINKKSARVRLISVMLTWKEKTVNSVIFPQFLNWTISQHSEYFSRRPKYGVTLKLGATTSRHKSRLIAIYHEETFPFRQVC